MIRRGHVPAATYRLQFGRGFGFREALDVIPYLADLGVSDVYASPLLAAQRGGSGYDTVDPARLDPALGSVEDFERFWTALRTHRMGLVLDVVPNHMAANPDENAWWRDVLRRGRASPFAEWFDIDWEAPGLEGRILLPVLEAPLDEALARGDLRVEVPGASAEPVVRYGARTFPVAVGSWTVRAVTDAGRDRTALAALLDRQVYRLADWRTGNASVTYRRFFDYSDLVAVRQEDPAVFDATHGFVLRLVERGEREGVPVGLRIDHVDGLADPVGYLRRLREAAPGASIVVEKILARGEDLPDAWPVSGESGYAFMDAVDGLCIDAAGVPAMHAAMPVERTGEPVPSFDAIGWASKRTVIAQLFGSERDRLTRIAGRIAAGRAAGHLTERDLERAIVELTVALPVYRTYLRAGTAPSARDRRLIAHATAIARGAMPTTTGGDAASAFLREALLSAGSGDPLADELAIRWQQLSGAVAAKGVEDTAFYRDPRVPSRCEVGADPGSPAVTVEAFHGSMIRRARRWPGASSATSTHDTKWSEDARARLHVLSEASGEWLARFGRWRAWNERFLREVAGRTVPSPAEEAAAYAALLAIWPLQGWAGVDDEFTERLCAHVVKAARQAKVDTDWIEPDRHHEAALGEFVTALLSSRRSRFGRELATFGAFLGFHGAIDALAGVVLKVAAPGVPDTYQGTELWTPRLVDPDNRGSVDFERRRRLLADMDAAEPPAEQLLGRWSDGRLKLFVLSRALRLRREHQDLFANGRYVPIEARGRPREHVVAFARRRRRSWALAVVPRLTARLSSTDPGDPLRWPIGEGTWGRSSLTLPEAAPTRWLDAFTGRSLVADATHHGPALPLMEVFASLPVALLVPEA